MNQARNDDGSYGDGWYHDDQQLPPSLGVWPLGRTYVHSSDGALNTGPAGDGGPGANGHGGAERSFDGDQIAPPPFSGAAGDGSTPLYERLALYERLSASPPADPGPSRNGRPPLYQVGGKYRGDDWPTDPGFRRGDLDLEDFPADPAPARGRPDPGYDPGPGAGPDPGYAQPRRDPSFGGPDPRYAQPRRDPSFGGPDPRYQEPRREAGQGWRGAAYPEGGAHAGPSPSAVPGHDLTPSPSAAPGYDPTPGPYAPPGYDAAPGRGGPGYGAAVGRGAEGARGREPRSAPPPAAGYDAGAGMAARGPEQGKWRQQRHPQPVARIRPDTPAVQGQGRQGGETWERNVTPAARVAAMEDARLLAFLHDLIKRLKAVASLYPRLVFLIVGYAAVTSLAAAYALAIPLPITASLIVIPAAGVIFNLGMRYPDWGRRALVGWLAGIVATIVCDVLRLSLVKVGIWGDPIPAIGRLVFADPHANFAWGYLWRFAGNGGGMGIAYTMLPWRGVRTGVAYGTLICTGLVALLFFFPVAQAHSFALTPVTTAGAYAGHWVYGAVLGKITSWWLPPVELGRIRGRLTARLIHPGHRPRPAHARSAGAAGDPRGAAPRRSA